MSAYILSLTVASIAAAVALLLAPRGDGGRMASYVRMIAGLFLLVALLGPIKEGITLLSSIADGSLAEDIMDAFPERPATDYESTLAASLTQMTASEVEIWVVSTLAEMFAVPESDITLSALCAPADDGLTVTVCELRIALSGNSALVDPHPIEAYFEEALNAPCHVTVMG